MKLAIQLLGIFFILVGIFFTVNPGGFYIWLEDSLNNNSLYLIAIIGRIVIGILLILNAKKSKYPTFFTFFGYLAIFAAIVFILIGQESFNEFVAGLMSNLKFISPVIGLLILAFGCFIIYAMSGSKKIENKNLHHE